MNNNRSIIKVINITGKMGDFVTLEELMEKSKRSAVIKNMIDDKTMEWMELSEIEQ